MRRLAYVFLILALVLPLTLGQGVFAGVGVGVGTGEIKLDKPIKAGGIYTIPTLQITNTGDEAGNYKIGLAFHVERKQLRPKLEWFSFEPSRFFLEPGKSQRVEIKLTIPLKAQPGDYFTYLESSSFTEEEHVTKVGVAVGTRLFFTVIPSNIWQAITFRASSLWKMYSPWNWVVLGVVLAAILIVFFKKKFAFQIGVKKK